MIYNAKNPVEKESAKKKFEKLIDNEKRFELTEKKGNKTPSQNRYLHLILGWFALEYGEKMDYVKQEILKKIVNIEIFKTEFANRKTGEVRIAWRSWADLDTREAALSITRFRNYSSQVAGIYLPEANELAMLNSIEEQLSKYTNKEYI